jgi:hypothetical protein
MEVVPSVLYSEWTRDPVFNEGSQLVVVLHLNTAVLEEVEKDM